MGGIIEKLKGWWLAATPSRRLVTLGGIALTLVLALTVASYAGRPKFTMLFGGLSAADQAAVVGEVQAMGVPVNYDTAGTVEVPEGKAAEVRMRLATTGKLPKSSHPGIGDLGAMNLYTTPAVERERLKSILEGELSKSIETVPSVGSARVHLTLGDPSPFGDQRRAATASVNVVQNAAGTLTGEQARGIAMLVANAVDGLELKNVVVLNERMEPIFNGSDTVGSEHVAEKKIDLERGVAKGEERKLQSALDTMFGPGSTLVTVRAEVDLDEEDTTTSAHLVKEGQATETAQEKMKDGGGGGSAPTPAGFASNGGAPAAAPASGAGGGSGEYSQKVTRYEPGSSDTVTKRKKATGGMRRMLINVAANTARFDKPEDADAFVASVKGFVGNEFGNQADRASFQALVTPVKFDTSAQTMAAKAQEEAGGLAKRQQLISLLPVAALLVVGFLVVRTIGGIGKAANAGSEAAALGGSGLALGAGAAGLPAGAGASGAAGGASPLEAALQSHFGEGGAPLGLGSGGLGSGLPGGLPGGAPGSEGGIEFESDEERIRISKIKERTSIPLEQIRQMSVERPEAVAMLVKSWLMDEKK